MNFLERVGLVSQVKVGDYIVSANKPLGNGAFGTVNVGHNQTNTNEIVAIKIVKRHAKNDYLVQREIQLLQELKGYGCENILMFLHSEKDSSNFYLVTEFCNGGTLTKLFTAKKRLSDVEAKIFMRQIASAVKFLDKEEIAHRDLKPDNILIDTKDPDSVDLNGMTFKIADFGLATKIPKGKSANSKCGSCFYMAPEIFKVKYRFYDRKVDLWSLGVILYQGVVGVLPFKVRNMRRFEDMERLMSTPVNAVLPTWLSLDARDLINSLLTYCPSRRINFDKFFEHPFLIKDKSTPPPPATVLPFARHSSASVGTLVNTSSFDKQEDLLLNGMLAPTTIHDVSSNLLDFVIVDSQFCYLKTQKVEEKEILPKITPPNAAALCIIS